MGGNQCRKGIILNPLRLKLLKGQDHLGAERNVVIKQALPESVDHSFSSVAVAPHNAADTGMTLLQQRSRSKVTDTLKIDIVAIFLNIGIINIDDPAAVICKNMGVFHAVFAYRLPNNAVRILEGYL